MNILYRTAYLFAILSLLAGFETASANNYCMSSGSNTYYEWIDAININGEEYISGNNSGYFEHIGSEILLSPGANTIDVTPGFRRWNYTEHWRGWIDLNGDGIYAEEEIVFEHIGSSSHSVAYELPSETVSGITGMRIAMSYGAYPEACGNYYYGETEDFIVTIDAGDPPLELTHYLALDYDFTVHRDGAIGDNVSWVVERDGAIVLKRNAAGELEYRHFYNYQGGDFRIWLQSIVEGSYQRISNIVEYSPGITDLFELTLGSDFELHRSGQFGDDVQWVIERDGEIVLQRNAADELSYTYYNNNPGSLFRTWLQQFIDGEYRIVSNTVEYMDEKSSFTLSADQQFKLKRNGQLGDPVQWVIEQDGSIVLQRNAANELSYTYFNNTPGSSYRVWLQMFIDGSYQVVSNIVEYDVQASFPYTLSLGTGYQVNRSGSLGEPVQWVIVKNGNVVLQRNAANELSYTYYSNTPGSTIQVYLQQFIGGYYQPVSNTVQYAVP